MPIVTRIGTVQNAAHLFLAVCLARAFLLFGPGDSLAAFFVPPGPATAALALLLAAAFEGALAAEVLRACPALAASFFRFFSTFL